MSARSRRRASKHQHTHPKTYIRLPEPNLDADYDHLWVVNATAEQTATTR